MVVGALQSFKFFRQKSLVSLKQQSLSKSLYTDLRYLISIIKSYLNLSMKNNFILTTQSTLRNLQTSRVNNSRIVRINNAKFSGHCFIWTQAQGRFSNMHQCNFNLKAVRKQLSIQSQFRSSCSSVFCSCFKKSESESKVCSCFIKISRRYQMFFKIGILENFTIFTEKHLR